MSQSQPTAHELDCPNCGASYELPKFGNRAECAYCGSQFIVPASARASNFTSPVVDEQSVTLARENAVRWIRWLVIIIVFTTVVPLLCTFIFGICGALFGVVAQFFR